MLSKVIFSVVSGLITLLGLTSLFNPAQYLNNYFNHKKIQQQAEERQRVHLAYLRQQQHWTDSILASMTDDQKIGQLFMVAAYSNRNETHYQEIDQLISNYHIGGLIFFQGGPVRQAILTNRYQAKSKIPLLISMDAEWGLGMRLDSTISFPRAMTLGAIPNDQLIYEMGTEIARQMKRLGVHVNFAPVADVNVNPANPVIGTRSFGENKYKVAEKAIAYAKGLQHSGIIANAKHFPGHGDTDADSHYTLPVIKHDKQRMNDIELYPFKRLIADSIMSMMVAHIHMPVYDSTPNKATTLSKTVVSDLLRNELGFEGLVFTDALNMKGVSSFYKPGETDLLALLAGNDCLLFPMDVAKGVAQIKQALADKRIGMAEIEERVRRILLAKYFAGLHQYKPVALAGLVKDLNTPKAEALRALLYEQAITIVRNQSNLLPFHALDTLSFASVVIGESKDNDFQRVLSKYAPFENYATADKGTGSSAYEDVFKKVKGKKAVIIGLLNVNVNNKAENNYGIGKATISFIEALEKETNVVVVVFGNAYSLKTFEKSRHLVCAYDRHSDVQIAVPQLLFGATATQARLPVTVAPNMQAGSGISTISLNRIRYSFVPESVGLDRYVLNKIDTIAKKAIATKATPGCQVVIAKDGRIVFSRNYGYHTYDDHQPVTDQSVYDIASVTKVASTMQAIMYLYDRGVIDVEKTVGDYLPDTKGTNKEKIKLKDLLTHQAGLVQSMPHWSKTAEKGQLKTDLFSNECQDEFCTPVAEQLYASSDMRAMVWQWTKDLALRKNKRPDGSYGYLYSDVGFYILKEIAERKLGQSLDYFMETQFYHPLGLSTTGYLPLRYLNQTQITPSEEDKHFRKKTVQGTVHDPDAALMGGVAGHAGVFSNAHDLAVLMQMNLQKGDYGGRRYFINDATVPFFTEKRVFADNRRGLGWDKPLKGTGGPTSNQVSPRTFGHTGFTGTCVWVDPEYNIVYVFLSNRTFPSASNWKLMQMEVRNQIQDVVYEAMHLPRVKRGELY